MVRLDIPCKICRIGRKNGEFLSFVNNLISRGYSVRKIEKLTYDKFSIFVSKSSVQIHKEHYLQPQPEEERNHEFYSKSAKAITHY